MGGPSNNSGGNTGADEGFFNSERERKRKQNKKNREEAERMDRENRGGGNNQQTKKSKKSEEQPKVKSQMDNTEIKSKEVDADKTAPTEVEIDQDDILLKNKKKGRNVTVLTSVTGVKDQPTLSKKYLLGD